MKLLKSITKYIDKLKDNKLIIKINSVYNKLKNKVFSDTNIKLYKRMLWGLLRISLIFISFIAIDQGFNSLVGNKLNMGEISDNFSIIYIGVITLFMIGLPRIIQLIVYSITYLGLFFVVISQYFYFSILNSFLSLTDFNNAGEGIDYFSIVFDYISINLVYNILLLIFIFAITFIMLKKKDRLINGLFYKVGFFIIFFNLSVFCFYINHDDTVELLGEVHDSSDFIEIDSDRNSYNEFIDKVVSMEICGLYEYIVRDIYLYYINNYGDNSVEAREMISTYMAFNEKENDSNSYSDVLKDKNVIFIMMETMDTWLINDINTPTIMDMRDEGFTFLNHYAQPFGGGSTFNSEHAVNTGFYIPNNGYNIYNSVENYYPESLPRLFEDKGYITTSIHGNSGEFYNRNEFHEMYGYQNSYFSEEIGYEFLDDRDLVKDDIYKYIVPSTDEKFMTFITTYSGHGPFGESNKLSDMVNNINGKASVTDEFISTLKSRLDDDGILEDTAIVLFGDHYAYTFVDQEYVIDVKNIDNENEIHRVPFIIWGDNLESLEINEYSDQQDMIPIISNLFGLNYTSSNFLGTDVFNDNHNNYVYFRDLSYLGEKDNDTFISEFIEINDNIVMDNYFYYLNK